MMKILHIHISKNGGTFITQNFTAHFDATGMYNVDEEGKLLSDFTADAAGITARHDFVSGHIPFRYLKEFTNRFDLIVSSYRNPWSRTWSMFRFVTMNIPQWDYLRPVGQADVLEKFEAFID